MEKEIYKIEKINANLIDNANAIWLQQYKIEHPNDKITLKYLDYEEIQGYLYLRKDAVTELWNLPYIEIVSELPPLHNWHDVNCTIQIILTAENGNKLQIQEPDLVYAFRFLTRVSENNFAYTYCNYILDEHVKILRNFEAEINYKIS